MNEQVKTVHFWLGMLAVGIPAAMEAGLIPEGSVYARVGHLLMALISYAGIQSAARWMPARVIEKLDAKDASKNLAKEPVQPPEIPADALK